MKLTENKFLVRLRNVQKTIACNKDSLPIELDTVILPTIIICFILNFFVTLPSDVSKTLFTISAALIAIFFTAFSFMYKEYIELIAKSQVEAVSLSKLNKEEEKEEKEMRKELLLAPLNFPRSSIKGLLRCLILLVVSLVVSAIGYFGSVPYCPIIASATFLLFLTHLVFLVTRLLFDLYKRCITAISYIEKR